MQKLIDYIGEFFNIQNKFWFASIITFFVLWSIFVLHNNFENYIISLNLNFQNELFSNKYSNNKIINDAITIIEIDNKTLQDPNMWWLWRWQDFRRTYYAKVIDNLKKSWVKVIWIDVLFSEKSACITNKDDDIVLSESIKNAWNVILAFQNNSNIYPLDILKNAAYKLWDVFPIVNKYNTNVYSIYPFYFDLQNFYESFALSLVRAFYEKENKNIWDFCIWENSFKFFDQIIPFSKNVYFKLKKDFLINYTSKNNFRRISFIDIYNWKFDPNLIKNKIVLIWSNATWLHDEYNTPIMQHMPWVHIHAHAVNTLLNKKFIRYFSFTWEILLLLLFTYLISILWIYNKNNYYFVVSLFVLFIAYFYIYIFFFKYYYIIFSFPLFFFLSIILSFLFVNIYKYIYEDKWKRLLQNALWQYLSENLVKKVLHNYEKIKLWWTAKESTIFFSDIAWFTNISEKIKPEELVWFLSLYLKEMSDLIIENSWFINKYFWDWIMALWWSFDENINQNYLACKTAIEQQKKLKILNEKLKNEFWFIISIRIWINKWNVIVWNIWSLGKKIEYTALWDNVNIASRLEWINKFYNTSICVSESVKKWLEKNFVFRLLDKITVKWKENPILIYELLWFQQDVNTTKREVIKNFEFWLKLYMNWDFKEALDIFEKLETNWDLPSNSFVKRCKNFINNPPLNSWDGTWRYDEK
jgi:adenylate cyclase